MGYRKTVCRECGGSGESWTCGGRPEDRRVVGVCGRCGGAGEIRVFVYERPAVTRGRQ